MTSQKNYVFFSLMTTAIVVGSFFTISACSDSQAKAKPNFVFKDAPKAGVVAKIGSEEITEEQLMGDNKVEFIEIKRKEYDLKMDSLNRILVDKLIGAEAKKANLSTEEFIDKKVVGGKVKISDSEYKKFVEEKKIPKEQINDQMKERITNYMETTKKQDMIQAYVAKLTKSTPVEVYFSKPKMNVQVEIGNSPSFGSKSAKVTIVEFSDFQCPFCSKAAETVTQLKKKYGNKIQLAFKHFPLPMHREAKPASEASMCINEQSTDKFWKFHDIVFKNQEKLDEASLEKYAKDAGADVAKYKECVAAKKYADVVAKDMEYGEKIGVRSTPTFFINGQLVAGALPIESFSEIIDEELESK